MSSWFDTQVQHLRKQIPFVSPSLLSFIDTVITHDLDNSEVALTCRYRRDVNSGKWYTLTWTEADGSRRNVSAQDFSLLLWRAVQVHINVEEQENPKKHAYIDQECIKCALEGKPLKPYYNDGHYYGHHCADHMPKDATTTTKLFVAIGDKEYDLLGILAACEQPILDLERAGYDANCIGRLEACEFAWSFTKNEIPYLRITEPGREFFVQKEFGNGDSE